jgi:SAM-dependent methyltransferase
MAGKALKGWFITRGRKGDRTLKQQLRGLGPLTAAVKGKTVLDVGCAEGLISTYLADHGALAVHGIEVRPDHVDLGRKLIGERPVTLETADANEYKPRRQYDIVIMLALLHKLKDPAAACMRFAAAARELVVLRLPPKHAPLIIDDRSYSQPFNMVECMKHAGFECTSQGYTGPFDEWMGYYRRVS